MQEIFSKKCPACKVTLKLQWIKSQSGKQVGIVCPKCKKTIKISVPIDPDANSDTLIEKNETVYKSATLLLQENAYNKSEEFKIIQALSLVGRKSASKAVDIPLSTVDKRISRLHFVIKRYSESDGFKYSATPRQNTNGILINGTKISPEEEVYLKNNDKITIGSSLLTFNGQL